MGNAMRTLWGDSPAVTRLACVAYPAVSAAVLVASPLVPRARATLLCCLHTVLHRRYVWAPFLSILYRPIQHLMSIMMMLLEIYLSLAYLPERERDLGSCRFLGWAFAVSGAVNAIFLTAMSLCRLLVGNSYELYCSQGLLILLMVCITLRCLDNPHEPISVFGLARVPNRWYPVMLAAVLSVLSGGILWDVVSALVVGYAHSPLQLESRLLPPARAVALERGHLCGSFRLLCGRLGSWVPVHAARGYADLESTGRRYHSLSEMSSANAQQLGIGASSDVPLFRGPAMPRSHSSPNGFDGFAMGPELSADVAGGPAGGRQFPNVENERPGRSVSAMPSFD